MVLHESARAQRLLPGAAVIARIRRLFVLALISSFAYGVFSTGGRGSCPGGFDGDGGFIDAAGNPTSQEPLCITVNLQPSPLMFLGIALIVFFAIGRVLKAADEPTALRTLDRAAMAIAILVVCALVISRVWFGLFPLADIDPRSFQIFAPFPFGVFDIVVTPMQGSSGAL